MLFVLDASVALAWSFEDESSPYADSAIGALGVDSAVAPVIWPLEIGNALLSALRRRRLREVDAARFLATLERLDVVVDSPSDLGMVGRSLVPLAVTYGLSTYDASYLELALRRGAPLATENRRLAEAAVAAGIDIFHP